MYALLMGEIVHGVRVNLYKPSNKLLADSTIMGSGAMDRDRTDPNAIDTDHLSTYTVILNGHRCEEIELRTRKKCNGEDEKMDKKSKKRTFYSSFMKYIATHGKISDAFSSDIHLAIAV